MTTKAREELPSPLIIAMPALNEAAHIPGMVESIRAVLGDKPRILVVDDGSTDGTTEAAHSAGAHVITHHRTLGLGHSFRDILMYSLAQGAELLVTIDADGQFDPREIPQLIEPITSGRADFVAGRRFANGRSDRPRNMTRTKFYGNMCMNFLIRRITGRDVTDASSGFRAYSREALLQLNLHGSFTYTQETFLDLATKHVAIEQVPVSVEYRKGRRSRVVRNVLQYALRSSATILRTVRDHRPLLIFGTPAIVLCVTGFAAAVFTFVHYLATGSFSPYIFVGMTGGYLFSLGLVIGIVGVASDMLRPIRRNQESMLYLLKRQQYYGNSESSERSREQD